MTLHSDRSDRPKDDSLTLLRLLLFGSPKSDGSRQGSPKKGNSIGMRLLAGFSALILLCSAFGVVGVGFLAISPSAYAMVLRNEPPAVRTQMPGAPTPTNVPDVPVSDGTKTDSQGMQVDSYCPPGAPTIDFSGGQTLIGTKKWIESLPKEPPEGTAICVSTRIYNGFLKVGVTFSSGIFSGQKMTGLDVLAHHYSYATVGNDSRFAELKTALATIKPATNPSKGELKDTGWVMLPGYSALNKQSQPICSGDNCFKSDPIPTATASPAATLTATPFQPMPLQSTATLTPMPTAQFTPTPVYADMVIVPVFPSSTPVPQHATAQANITSAEWKLIHEQAIAYEGAHCQHIYNVDLHTLSSHELWAYTDHLDWTNGDLGWEAWGARRDIYVTGDQSNYVLYSVCARITNMPDTNNIDGNGTKWQGGISYYYAPGNPDPETGLIKTPNGTYYVNVYGVWFGPAFPKSNDYPTYQPYDAITLVNGFDQKFNDVVAVNAGDFPTASNPKILMTAAGKKFWVNFNLYLGNINAAAGGTLKLTACPASGGYKFAGNNASGDWCIVPGQ